MVKPGPAKRSLWWYISLIIVWIFVFFWNLISYRVQGADIDDEKTKGIIPRIVEQIFDSIIAAPSNLEFTVKVSYMEIYMEKVRDLLNRK